MSPEGLQNSIWGILLRRLGVQVVFFYYVPSLHLCSAPQFRAPDQGTWEKGIT